MSTRTGFCLMVDTIVEGTTPSLLDAGGRAWVFSSRVEAELEIADLVLDRFQEFLDGDRDAEDVMEVEEFIAEVTIIDGSRIVDEWGRIFQCCVAERFARSAASAKANAKLPKPR